MKRTLAAAILAACLLPTGALAQRAGPYWAVAFGWSYIHGGTYATAYGAAWNFADHEEAKAAATRECQRRASGLDVECRSTGIGKHSCFSIFRQGFRDRNNVLHYRYFSNLTPPSDAERYVNERIAAGQDYSIEVSECTGNAQAG